MGTPDGGAGTADRPWCGETGAFTRVTMNRDGRMSSTSLTEALSGADGSERESVVDDQECSMQRAACETAGAGAITCVAHLACNI